MPLRGTGLSRRNVDETQGTEMGLGIEDLCPLSTHPPKESGFCHTYVHLEEDPKPPEENVACPTCGPPKSHMVPDFCPTDLCRDTRMAP